MALEEDIVIRAKVRLQKQSPFFSYLTQTLNVKVVDVVPIDNSIKSACVDEDGNLFITKSFVMKIGEDKCVGVLCHEILHVALDHIGRDGGDRIKKLANIAQDIAINDMLVSNDFDLPEGAVPRADHTMDVFGIHIENIDKKTWEEIYEELKKGVEKDSECVCLDIGWDEKMEPKGDKKEGEREGDSSTPDLEAQIKRTEKAQQLLSEAFSYAKLQGKEPAGVEDRLMKLLASKVDWREVLQMYITRALPYDYSFARPSRRSHATGIYMPNVVREGIEVCVALDTSGSISPEDLRDFASEVLGIASTFQGVTVHLIQADSAVHEDITVSGDYEDIISNITTKGGGGTSHVPVFEHVDNEHPNSRVLICFTDGYTDFPLDKYGFDTVWALSKNSVSEDSLPFGRVVKVNE